MTLDVNEQWVLIPSRLGQGQEFEILITSAFLHGGFWHLAGNMLFLRIYGDNLEDEMGHSKFLCFYILCALAAGLVQMVSDPGINYSSRRCLRRCCRGYGGYLLL